MLWSIGDFLKWAKTFKLTADIWVFQLNLLETSHPILLLIKGLFYKSGLLMMGRISTQVSATEIDGLCTTLLNPVIKHLEVCVMRPILLKEVPYNSKPQQFSIWRANAIVFLHVLAHSLLVVSSAELQLWAELNLCRCDTNGSLHHWQHRFEFSVCMINTTCLYETFVRHSAHCTNSL